MTCVVCVNAPQSQSPPLCGRVLTVEATCTVVSLLVAAAKLVVMVGTVRNGTVACVFCGTGRAGIQTISWNVCTAFRIGDGLVYM